MFTVTPCVIKLAVKPVVRSPCKVFLSWHYTRGATPVEPGIEQRLFLTMYMYRQERGVIVCGCFDWMHSLNKFMLNYDKLSRIFHVYSGREIAPNTGANATIIIFHFGDQILKISRQIGD